MSLPPPPPALLLLALAGLSMPGCDRTQIPPPPADFIAHAAGWHISAPASWEIAKADAPTAWIALDPESVDGYRAHVLVQTKAFIGDSYNLAEANVRAMRDTTGVTIEATRDIVLDGDRAMIIESRWHQKDDKPTRSMATGLATNGTGFVASCSVAASAFERYRHTCEAILRSITIQR